MPLNHLNMALQHDAGFVITRAQLAFRLDADDYPGVRPLRLTVKTVEI